MYKNQLQELAQRSCFNLPSYACTREGPDHAPRFKACVNFNGELFESPSHSSTLRQAEHSAAQVALNNLSTRGPSRSLTARVLDETGVYKNLLQETAHRAGLKLPLYTTVRSGPGHAPVFTCSVELAGMIFTGDSGKTKKQAEKNAAIAAWSSLKTMPLFQSSSRTSNQHHQNQNQVGGRRGKRVNISGSHVNHLHLPPHDQERMFMDLLISSEGVFPCSSSKKSFVSLLPPPLPPRTTSKILPPLLSPVVQVKDQPPLDPQEYKGKSDAGSRNVFGESLPVVQVQHQHGASNSASYRIPPPMVQVIKKDVQPPLDHQEHGVIIASKSASSSRYVYGTSPVYNTSHEKQTHNSIRNNFVGLDQVMAAISSSINYPNHSMRNSKGYAPAVQMRSVIPVCSAAPKSTPTHLPLPLVKDVEVSASIISMTSYICDSCLAS